MSRVYFHSPHGTAEVYGTERHYAGWICAKLCKVAMDLDRDAWRSDKHPMRHLVPQDSYLLARGYTKNFSERLATSLMSGSVDFVVDGERLEAFSAVLNTAIVAGSDVMKFMARLHGQCELHGYVEGTNRAWLARIIQTGLETRVLRSKSGWEDVIELLLSRDDCPVVTSYSVTESFPNKEMAEHGEWERREDGDGDSFYYLSDDEAWGYSMRGLRRLASGREWSPETWDGFCFTHGWNGFSLLARALEIEAKEQEANISEMDKQVLGRLGG